MLENVVGRIEEILAFGEDTDKVGLLAV